MSVQYFHFDGLLARKKQFCKFPSASNRKALLACERRNYRGSPKTFSLDKVSLPNRPYIKKSGVSEEHRHLVYFCIWWRAFRLIHSACRTPEMRALTLVALAAVGLAAAAQKDALRGSLMNAIRAANANAVVDAAETTELLDSTTTGTGGGEI